MKRLMNGAVGVKYTRGGGGDVRGDGIVGDGQGEDIASACVRVRL